MAAPGDGGLDGGLCCAVFADLWCLPASWQTTAVLLPAAVVRAGGVGNHGTVQAGPPHQHAGPLSWGIPGFKPLHLFFPGPVARLRDQVESPCGVRPK